jgi:hypothetical protein
MIALLKQFRITVDSSWIDSVNKAKKHLKETKPTY